MENALTPIFSYQEHENNICETGGESTYVKYNQVCENEFFATTQKGMDALVGLKKEMIEKYNVEFNTQTTPSGSDGSVLVDIKNYL